MNILGLDIGGTKTAVVVGDERGTIHRRREFATLPQRGFQSVFDELCHTIESALDTGPAAISVSIGGPLAIEPGVIKSPPNLPGWDEIPLRELLVQRFGLPVFIEHDGNAGALAEWYFGAARGLRNVIFLTMGTGFGGGLILNGRLYRGTCDLAGEVGHVRLADGGPPGFGKPGSWEGLCGGAGITQLAVQRDPQRWSANVTVRELAAAAHQGDAASSALFREVGEHLGRGLALLVDILNPQMIVIGSLAVRLGDLVLAPARTILRREALPAAADACRVVPAALGERLGDVAALMAVIHDCRTSH